MRGLLFSDISRGITMGKQNGGRWLAQSCGGGGDGGGTAS